MEPKPQNPHLAAIDDMNRPVCQSGRVERAACSSWSISLTIASTRLAVSGSANALRSRSLPRPDAGCSCSLTVVTSVGVVTLLWLCNGIRAASVEVETAVAGEAV